MIGGDIAEIRDIEDLSLHRIIDISGFVRSNGDFLWAYRQMTGLTVGERVWRFDIQGRLPVLPGN